MAKPDKRVNDKKPRSGGPKPKYNLESFIPVLDDYAEGEYLTKALKKHNITINAYYRHKASNEELQKLYQEATEAHCFKKMDAFRELAFQKPETEFEQKNYGSFVNHQKLKIWTEMWVISKLAHKLFGDKSNVNIEANTVNIKPEDVDNMSFEDAMKAVLE